MKEILFSLVCLTLLAASPGCKAKPTEEACKEAIQNVRVLTELDKSDIGADPKAAVRSCRANSTKETVECMRNSKTLAELEACEGELGKQFFKEEEEREAKLKAEQEKKEKDKDED